MNVFLLPFILVGKAIAAFFWLPLTIQLLLLIVIGIWILVSSLREAGPFRIAALARRFSWLGIPLGALVFLWLWLAIIPSFPGSHIGLWYAFYSGLLMLSAFAGAWYVLAVVNRRHNDKRLWLRAYSRMRLRLRWDSIAKSCALSHMKDVRPKDWIRGGTATTVLATRVQWTPILWHGRRSRAGDSTDYLFRPARGFDTSNVNDKLAAIAIAAHAHSCTLNDSQYMNWWMLTVYWTDPAKMRPPLDWIDAESNLVS